MERLQSEISNSPSWPHRDGQTSVRLLSLNGWPKIARGKRVMAGRHLGCPASKYSSFSHQMEEGGRRPDDLVNDGPG